MCKIRYGFCIIWGVGLLKKAKANIETFIFNVVNFNFPCKRITRDFDTIAVKPVSEMDKWRTETELQYRSNSSVGLQNKWSQMIMGYH